MDVSFVITHLKTWGIKGGLSLLDQGLYSGANFVLSIVLARWLLPSQYGVFSIAFAIYLFAYQIHNAILVETMSVLGPASNHHRLANYIREQIRLHFVLSIPAGLAVIALGLVIMVFDGILGRAILFMGMVLPFMLLPLLMRRVFYIFQKPYFALLGSGVYAVSMFGSLWAVTIFTDLSVDSAFPILGLAGLVSGTFLIQQVPARGSYLLPVGSVWSSNWEYGKWLVFSSVLIALAGQAQTFVVGGLLGLSDTGAFRALQNFVQPIILFFTAVCAFFLPSLSYDFGTGNISGLKRKGKYLLIMFIVVSVFYELFLFLYGPAVESLVYRGKFSHYDFLIPVWGLVPIAGALTYVYYFLLQSIQRPRAILWGSMIWAAANVIGSILFTIQWGLAGAIVSVVTGYLLSGIAFGVLYWHYISELKKTRSQG
jgi:O-antigen/teichoic acid export membrane protein